MQFKLNSTEKDKIRRFMADQIMSEAVYKVFVNSFFAKKERDDVNMTAAQRIALDLLHEGYKELERNKMQEEIDKKELKQVGI